MPKRFKLVLTEEERQAKKAKLAKVTDKQLVQQAIATGVVFGIVFSLLQFNTIKKEYDGSVIGAGIFLVINGVVFGLLWFVLLRYQRNKARKGEK